MQNYDRFGKIRFGMMRVSLFASHPAILDTMIGKHTPVKLTCSKFRISTGNTVEPRHLELAYFELPLISK